MCGIAGWLSYSQNMDAQRDTLQRMTDTMACVARMLADCGSTGRSAWAIAGCRSSTWQAVVNR